MKTLASLKPGESGIVYTISAEGAVKQRFLDMGLTQGVQVQLERRAPFGDPLAIRLDGGAAHQRALCGHVPDAARGDEPRETAVELCK